MTDLRKAAEDLLEGVEAAIKAGDWKVDGACDPDSAIVRLRQALTQPVDAVNMSQERVDETAKREHDLVYRLRKRAEIRRQIDTRKSVQEGKPDRIADLLEEAADYIEKREWVGLTEEDIDDIWKTEYFNLHYELPKAIEVKLKEKNT